MSMKELGIDKLSAAERLILAQEIWDSIDDPSLADVPPWQIEEVQRRIAAYDANTVSDTTRAEIERRVAKYETHPQTGHTYEEIKAALRANRA